MLTDSSFEKQTSVLRDTTALNGMPSIAQYIRKIFLVSDNDALPSGERPACEGAEVVVEGHRTGEAPLVLARGVTGAGGVFGFATPSDVASEQIALAVRAAGRNPRHVRLDGRRLALDLRRALYGTSSR